MAKFKAGQGAGRSGMLMGAAGQGGRGLCVLLPLCSAEHPKSALQRGNDCQAQPGVLGALGGIWVGGLVLLGGIRVSWRSTDATGGRLVLWRCYGGTGVAHGY